MPRGHATTVTQGTTGLDTQHPRQGRRSTRHHLAAALAFAGVLVAGALSPMSGLTAPHDATGSCGQQLVRTASSAECEARTPLPIYNSLGRNHKG
jgi:hypothetical protein